MSVSLDKGGWPAVSDAGPTHSSFAWEVSIVSARASLGWLQRASVGVTLVKTPRGVELYVERARISLLAGTRLRVVRLLPVCTLVPKG